MSAKQRTKEEMRNIAYGVLSGNSSNAKSINDRSINVSCIKEEAEYSIYSTQGQGFVIVSSDDNVTPVLGYSLDSRADGSMPDALKYFLANLDKSYDSSSETTNLVLMLDVDPMITTTWGQDDPYNRLCPDVNGKKVPAGCVAIALAQILNYCKYPESSKFTGNYTVEGGTSQYFKVNSTYSYPYLNEYSAGSFTDEEAEAVATLVRDCGYASSMEYTLAGSGSYPLTGAMGMINYMKYPVSAIKVHPHDVYTDDEWKDMIYSELAQGYPMYLGGYNSAYNDGHAFVICGNDQLGNVYINWGWDGQYNGYFSLSLMNPSSYDFSYHQDLIRGFHPKALESDVEETLFVAPSLYTIKPRTDANGFIVSVPDGIWNYSTRTKKVRIVVVAEDVETSKITSYNLYVGSTETSYAPMYGEGAGDYTISQRTALPAGTYRIYLATQSKSSDTGIYSDPQIIRTIGGKIYYNMVVGADGTVTIGTEPLSAGINPIIEKKCNDVQKAMYNLSGQRVSSNYKGFIVKNGKKYIAK